MTLQKPLIRVMHEDMPWYLFDTVGIEFGPTGCTVNDCDFMKKMTGADIVGKALKANAQYLVLFCKDTEYAYYKSKYRPLPESLEGRDLLREVCDAAGGRIHVLAYAVVQYDSYILRERPEYNQIDDLGRALGRICLRSPGYIEYMKGVLDELMEYDIVGIHVDMMDLGFSGPYGCWCEHCKAEFKKQHGHDMPAKFDMDDPEFRDFMEFRYTNNNNMARQLSDHVKSKNPAMTIDYNYHGAPPFSYPSGQRPVQHAAFGDFATAESLPWVFGYNNISLMSHMLEAANPQSPFQIVSSRSMHNYHEYSLRPTEDLRFEVMNVMANGGTFTLVDKAGYDGWFDPVVYDRISTVFAEAQRKAPYSRGYEKEPLCAVYFSHKTRDYRYREDIMGYHNTIVGLGHMLVSEKINYTFLFDENATIEKMRRFPLVILANTAILSHEEAAMLREYVSGGGNLLCTGAPGLFDTSGNQAGICAISDVLGAEFVGIGNAAMDTYLVFPDTTPDEYGFLMKGIESGYQLFAKGEMYAFRATTARTFGDLFTGYRPGVPLLDLDDINADIWKQLMSAGIRVCPGIFDNTFGRGRVLTIPCMLESAYMGSHRSPELRKLLCNAVRRLAGRPTVEVVAPLSTEAVTLHDREEGRTLVHLTTYNANLPVLDGYFFNDRRHFAPVMEEPKLYSASLKVNASFSGAYSVDGTPVSIGGDTIRFVTDRVHEVIIIEGMFT